LLDAQEENDKEEVKKESPLQQTLFEYDEMEELELLKNFKE